MKTLPQPSPKPQQPHIVAGQLSALDEVERLEAMTDDELMAERIDLIAATGETQALCAVIQDIQRRRNIEKSQNEANEKVRRVKVLLEAADPKDPFVKALWVAIRLGADA